MSLYLEARRYRGSDGAVVELDALQVRQGRRPVGSDGRRRTLWWWRFEGTEQWYGGAGLSKIDALIQAANERGMSAAQWDPQPAPPEP